MDGMPSSLAALPELRQSSRVVLTSNAGDLEVFHVEHARYAELAKAWLPAQLEVVGTQRPATLADVRGVSSFRVIAGARSFQEAFTRMTVGTWLLTYVVRLLKKYCGLLMLTALLLLLFVFVNVCRCWMPEMV